MTRNLIVLACIVLLFTACAAPQGSVVPTAVKAPAEATAIQVVQPSQAPSETPVPTAEPTETAIPTEPPTPTALPTPTEEPEFVPYSTDFSESDVNWEVLFSEKEYVVMQQNGEYILEASGLTSNVFSSPKGVVDAAELAIEVDVRFADTEGLGGMSGIFCGYLNEQTAVGFGINKTGYVHIATSNKYTTLDEVRFAKIFEDNVQQTHRLRAICSAEGLGLIVDGEKVLHYPIKNFKPGRIGLFSEGSFAYNTDATDTVDAPNTTIFDNFSTGALQPEDEWVKAPLNPFDYLKVGEVIYNEDFAAPVGAWTQFDYEKQSAKLNNGKLTLYDTGGDIINYSGLESFTGFNSGIMLETDFKVLPGAPDFYSVGFVCEVNGSLTNFYSINYYSRNMASFFRYYNNQYTGIGGSDVSLTEKITYLEPDRTYHLTGICGGGYLAMLLDDVPEFIMAIPDQKFQAVGLTGALPTREEGEVSIQFDNFKITKVETINN